MQKGFDTGLYLKQQTKRILERVNRYEKLYLEFGGKLCYDNHAARVLPGYDISTKIKLLKQLGKISIVYCISAKDIQKGRVRRDFNLTYDNQTLKDIGDIKDFGLDVEAVIITRFEGEQAAKKFRKKLENFGIKVYVHTEIPGYPNELDKVLIGYEGQPYVPVKNKLAIITGVGGGSGKMAFCMSQIHHERKKGIKTGFSKFESFPIWNIELNHPINIAYEAATADLRDVNMIDPHHKKAYGITAINYNRDVENYSILNDIMERITGEEFEFKSPTDMGVNAMKDGIVDDKVCREAAKQEIIRRYFRYYREKVEGIETEETVEWMKGIMDKAKVKPGDRKVVVAARKAEKSAKGFKNVQCGAAIEVNGRIVTGKNSSLLHAESAAILNAIKELARIPDEIHLLSEDVIKTITRMKEGLLGKKATSLNVDETLIALAISSTTNPTAKKALEQLEKLSGSEMHITHLPTAGDEAGLMRLKMNITTDAKLSFLSYFQ
ncbi:DUF1846 family protein [Candidatus Woesearchaeota archaeon]|nr:DUF1846 family protein [Candidatus Woesearchaeota archaeon]